MKATLPDKAKASSWSSTKVAQLPRKAKFNLWPYLFVSPYFLIYLTVGLFPILYTLYISFTDWQGFGDYRFVGFANYQFLFTKDPFFLQSLGTTLFFMVASIPALIILGLLLAVALFDGKVRFSNFYQTASFLPYVTTPIAIGLMFALLFDYNVGAVNQLLSRFGWIQEPVYWLGQAETSRWIVVLIIVWKYVGYHMVIYLAGLTNIPSDLYEAAAVDGAKPYQTFFHITLPLLKPVIVFLIITDLIGGFQVFEEPLMLFTGLNNAVGSGQIGGPDRSSFTLMWNLYDTAFGSTLRYGMGSAIAYATFLFIALFSFVSIRLLNRGEDV